MKKSLARQAFALSLPILCSYVFISMAYGMVMADAGFPWYTALLASLTIYTGTFQFALVSFLTAGASLGAIALTALLMNSRHIFYSLTFLEEFRRLGWRAPYLIYTLTDENYAVNCALAPDEPGRHTLMLLVALFSRCYWMLGTLCGALLGQWIPWDMTGIDFCMTALFEIILIDQWEKSRDHAPALWGGAIAFACLAVFGGANFMLPALLIISALLVFRDRKEARRG